MNYVVNFFTEEIPNYSKLIREQSLKQSPNGVYIKRNKR